MMARLFVAVWPPTRLLDQLAALPRTERPGLRWTRRDQWHVTLRFLGEVDVDEARATLATVSAPECSVVAGPRARRLGRGVFVLPVTGLESLAAAVGRATAGIGKPPEPRPFRGHITLARLGSASRCPGWCSRPNGPCAASRSSRAASPAPAPSTRRGRRWRWRRHYRRWSWSTTSSISSAWWRTTPATASRWVARTARSMSRPPTPTGNRSKCGWRRPTRAGLAELLRRRRGELAAFTPRRRRDGGDGHAVPRGSHDRDGSSACRSRWPPSAAVDRFRAGQVRSRSVAIGSGTSGHRSRWGPMRASAGSGGRRLAGPRLPRRRGRGHRSRRAGPGPDPGSTRSCRHRWRDPGGARGLPMPVVSNGSRVTPSSTGSAARRTSPRSTAP